ncbi:MAG: hypothetical protein K2I07_15185 [Lachnospiraceae bacterium]|nr:hypothetical protein [Lachnospiraceae bacterium]
MEEQAEQALSVAEHRLEEADNTVAEAEKKEALAEEKLAEAELAEERAGQNVDGIIAFSQGANIRIRLQMKEERGWSLMVYQGEELLLEIEKSSAPEMAEKFSDIIAEVGYSEEDTLLCEFIFNGTESGTNSAYHTVNHMFELLKNEYGHFFYSTIDLSVFEGSDM